MSTYDPTYWETLRANRGDIPRQVPEARFWEMLEVLPPEDWQRGDKFESFRVMECQTDDLYTWLVAIGRPSDDDTEYWEMIAPRSMTPADLAARIDAAREHACPRRPVEPDRGANWPFPTRPLAYPSPAPVAPDKRLQRADLARLPDALM